jgi:hypothetical protein
VEDKEFAKLTKNWAKGARLGLKGPGSIIQGIKGARLQKEAKGARLD